MWTRQEEKRVNGNNSSLDKVQHYQVERMTQWTRLLVTIPH